YIGPWSRKYGERKLIYAGLALLSVGLILTAVTPEVPVPWYSRAQVLESPSVSGGTQESVAVPLPDESHAGWLGLIWLMVAMVPTAIGGGVLSPSINSLITRRTPPTEVGGTLGVSTSLVSLANALTPLVGGLIFQVMGTSAPFLLGGLVMAALVFAALRWVQDIPAGEKPVPSAYERP
ncbi:MAG: MFS transporter, partial [Anaerolineae bacterium]|nr:MFS transporter [Anaerolineae bacterium]